jgi:hypothetical protein
MNLVAVAVVATVVAVVEITAQVAVDLLAVTHSLLQIGIPLQVAALIQVELLMLRLLQMDLQLPVLKHR